VLFGIDSFSPGGESKQTKNKTNKTMKQRIALLTALVLLALATTATQTGASAIYTPYAFTNFVGSPGVSGTNDGTGSAARFVEPTSIEVDASGNIFVAEFTNNVIRRVTSAGVVTTLAGSAGLAGTNDGTGGAARFNGPTELAMDAGGNIYVADYSNHIIRKVTVEGVVTTVAGVPGTPGTNDGPTNLAQFNSPIGVAVDSTTNIYVADTANNTIRRVSTDGMVTTLAGSPGQAGSADGAGSVARFNSPHQVKLDRAGALYVADTGNHTIRRVTPAGVVTTVAGRAGFTGSSDGTASLARFNTPTGVAIDTNGNVYVAEYVNDTIRRITTGGAVTTLAGLALYAGSADGIGDAARFNVSISVAVDAAGTLYVTDRDNFRVTKGTPVLQFDSAIGLTVSNGFFQMRLLGPPGSNVIIEASATLADWNSVLTNALPSSSRDVSVPIDTNPYQFFRAHLAP
jgi:streptogramin lyase